MMKLLFLYQKEVGASDSRQYNFDADWTFFYDFKRRQMRCQYRQVLPRNCFSENGVVQSVSAIIGENGSGKTSLARFMGRLGSPERNFLAVVETGDGINIVGYYAATWNEQDLLALPCEVRTRLHGKLKTDRPVLFSERRPFVYYTSFFTTERGRFSESGLALCDLSTTALLFQRREKGRAEDREASFRHEERIRVLEFLRAFRARPIQEFPMVMPGSMSVDVSEGVQRKWRQQGVKTKDLDPLDRFPQRYGLCAILLILSIGWIAGKDGSCHKTVDQLIYEFMKHEPEWWHPMGGIYVDFKREIFKRYFVTLVADVTNALGKIDRERAGQSRDFLLYVYALCRGTTNNIISGCWIHLPLDDRGIVRAMHVLEMYRKLQTRQFPDCLFFDFGNEISSGEMSFLTLFGRLYECFRKFPANAEPTVFLDETEITLHPAWQRKLVSLISWFLESMFPQMRTHLIFASHSPMLLSDIPSGNVVVLRNGQSERLQMNTFGASIFDLYNVAFGLSDGVFGMLAKRKLDSLLDKMQRHEQFDADDKRVAELFGNELISRHLMSWVNETNHS